MSNIVFEDVLDANILDADFAEQFEQEAIEKSKQGVAERDFAKLQTTRHDVQDLRLDGLPFYEWVIIKRLPDNNIDDWEAKAVTTTTHQDATFSIGRLFLLNQRSRKWVDAEKYMPRQQRIDLLKAEMTFPGSTDAPPAGDLTKAGWTHWVKTKFRYKQEESPELFGTHSLVPMTPLEDVYHLTVDAHVNTNGRHNGRDATYAKLSKVVSSTITKEYVKDFIDLCPKCEAKHEKNKESTKRAAAGRAETQKLKRQMQKEQPEVPQPTKKANSAPIRRNKKSNARAKTVAPVQQPIGLAQVEDKPGVIQQQLPEFAGQFGAITDRQRLCAEKHNMTPHDYWHENELVNRVWKDTQGRLYIWNPWATGDFPYTLIPDFENELQPELNLEASMPELVAPAFDGFSSPESMFLPSPPLYNQQQDGYFPAQYGYQPVLEQPAMYSQAPQPFLEQQYGYYDAAYQPAPQFY